MAWAVVTAALLLFGAPTFQDPGSEATTLDVQASELLLQGDISSTLERGAVMALAGARGELRAQTVEIAIYPYRHAMVSAPAGGFEYSLPGDPDVRRYENATIRFQVNELGHLYAAGADATLVVPRLDLTSSEFFGSESDWYYYTPDERHERTTPMLAFLQDPHDAFVSARHVQEGSSLLPTVTRISYDFPAAVFDRARLDAPDLLAVNRTTLAISHAAGSETVEIGETTRGAGPLQVREAREAVLRLTGATLSLELGGVSALLMGDEGKLVLDGTVGVRDAEGALVASARQHALRGGDLEMRGRFELVASPSGASLLSSERPGLAVGGTGVADELRWNGDALPETVPTPSTRPSLWAGLAALATLAATALLRGAFGLRIRDPLSHPKRAAILGALRRRGVLDRRGLEVATGLGRGTLVYHLGILSRHGAVLSFAWGDRAIYHLAAAHLSAEEARRLAPLTSATTAKLARALVQAGAASQADLAARAGLHPSTVSRLLRRLAQARLVEVDERGGGLRPSALLVEWAEGEG